MLEFALFRGCPLFLARPRCRVSTIAEEVPNLGHVPGDFLTLPDILTGLDHQVSETVASPVEP